MDEKSTMNVYNLLIIDESGSMNSIYKQALLAINKTLVGIRKAENEHPGQRQYVSIVTFEGSGVGAVKTRRDRIPIANVPFMMDTDYCPGGCTPLYDAMGQAISHLDECVRDGDAVLVTVITDGYENASREYSGPAIKQLVARQKEKGWTFAYIGANQDAEEVANELNISNALNFDASPAGMHAMSMRYEMARKKFLRKVDDCRDMVASQEAKNAFLGNQSDLFKED